MPAEQHKEATAHVGYQRRFAPAGQRVTMRFGVDEPSLAAIREAAGGGNATLSAATNDLVRRGAERLRARGLPALEDRPAKRVRWEPAGAITWTTISTDAETADLARNLAHRLYTTQNHALHLLLREGLRPD